MPKAIPVFAFVFAAYETTSGTRSYATKSNTKGLSLCPLCAQTRLADVSRQNVSVFASTSPILTLRAVPRGPKTACAGKSLSENAYYRAITDLGELLQEYPNSKNL